MKASNPLDDAADLINARDYLGAAQWITSNAKRVLATEEGTLDLADTSVPIVYLHRVAVAEADSDALFQLATAVWAQDGGELMGLHLMEAAADAGSTEAIAALGEALHWMGNSQAATPWLEKALRVGASRASWIHGLLGEAYASTGRPREAIESLELAAQDYSEFGVPLAKALIACGRLEDGRTLLETLVDSGEYGAAIQLGNLLSEEGDDDGAERAYRAGIETDDENSAFNLGLLYEGQGRHEEAREAFAMAEVLRDIWVPPQSDGDAEDG